MTSYALGGLAGSRRTLLLYSMQPRTASVGHGRHPARMTSHQKSDSVNRHVFIIEQFRQISSPSDSKRQTLGFLEERHTKSTNKNNKISSDMESLPGPKNEMDDLMK